MRPFEGAVELMYTLVQILMQLVNLYVVLIIIYCLFSWFPHENGFLGDCYRVLRSICEPYLGLFRKIIPPIRGGGMGIDISPIIAIVVLQLVMRLIVRLLL